MTDAHQSHHSSSHQKLAALLHLLEEETRQYEAASAKLREKQDILISGKPKKLPRLDQELTAISHKTRQLEQQRLSLMAELGHPNQNLSHLIADLEPQAAATLTPPRDRLVKAVQETTRLNQDTRDLLQLSMQWIQDTVELIANVLTPEAASYNAQGNKAGGAKHKANPSDPGQSTINHSA